MVQLFQCRCSKVVSPRMVTIFLCICLLVVSDGIADVYAKECAPGVKNSLGWTEPLGDIVIQVGSPLEIFCMLNPPQSGQNYSVGDVVFYRNNDHRIENRYVSVINETTSRLFIENMNESSDWYYCKLQRKRAPTTIKPYEATSLEQLGPKKSGDLYEDVVCSNMVAVGTKPKDVENFTCVSINWTILKCSWMVPNNFVRTNYTISYGPPPTRSSRSNMNACPTDDDVKNNRCEWTTESDPVYRRTYEYLIMLIKGTNKFGTNEQKIYFHHYAHIIPNPPTDLELLNKTRSSLYLKWKIGIFGVFSNGLLYKVQYTWSPSDEWHGIIYRSKNLTQQKDTVYLNVTDLPYPNTLYNFRVYMKKAEAQNDVGWSQYAYNVFRTKACPPYTSPKMDAGSFEIVHNPTSARTVYVYWQPLPLLQHNGEDFRYEIVVFENGRRIDLNATRVNHSYVEFVIALDKYYRFEVRSVNKEGAANYSTFVQVPAQENVVKQCSAFTKTDYGNGVYELSWEPPAGLDVDEIANYTIFWCESNKERPYQCDGDIGWEHFAAYETKHNFSANSSVSYQFAISVNTATSSSGMLWAMCTVLHGRVGTVKNVQSVHNGPDHVNLEWKLECSDKAVIISGYRIYYCVVSSNDKSVCAEPERDFVVDGSIHRTSGNVTGLKPFTQYKMSVMILTKDNRTGPRSADYFTLTKEGPPDVTGLTITVLNTTNTTAEIEWDVPRVRNGHLRGYYVLYDNESKKVPGDVSKTTLTGLQSYHVYNVTVKACTILAAVCSNPMKNVTLRTGIGVPSAVNKLHALNNGTHAFVSWDVPANPAGPNPIYEVRTLKNRVTADTVATNETTSTVPVPDCNGEKSHSSYEFMVRAKNVDAGVSMLGAWSPAYALQCVPAESPVIWKVTGCIFASLFVAVMFTYGGRKGLYKCKKMKSVQVTIPTKFTIPSSTYPVDSKDTELFDSYGLPQIKSADEFCTLVEKTI